MAKLITPTLFNSVDWLKKCPQSWKERAYNDLSNTLNRVYLQMPEAVQNGVDFEKKLMNFVAGPKTIADIKEENSNFKENLISAIQIIKDGEYQSKSKKVVEIDGIEYLLYGKLDVLLPDRVIDIKTTASYKGKSYYLSGWQHKFYCYNEYIDTFTYLVLELVSVNKVLKIRDIHCIEYYVKSFKDIGKEIVTKIESFLEFLEEVVHYAEANKWD